MKHSGLFRRNRLPAAVRRSSARLFAACFLLGSLLTACSQKTLPTTVTLTTFPTETPSLTATLTPTASLTPTVLPTATLTPTPTPPPFTGVVPLGARARLSKGSLQHFILSPDGKTIAVASSIDVCLYQVVDFNETWCSMTESSPMSRVESLAFDPQGKSLAAGLWNGDIVFWDVDSGLQQMVIHAQPKEGNIRSLAWSPDSSMVAASSALASGCGEGCTPHYAGEITVWDAHSGEQTRQIDAGMPVNAVAFNPDGTLIMAGLDNHEIRLYRLADGSVIQKLAAVDSAKGMAWLPDGKRLLTSNGVDTLVVWDVTSGKRLEVLLDGYAQLFGLVWSPDSTRLVTSSYQGTIFIWANATGQLLRKLDGEGMGASPVAWSPDGQQIASSGSQGVIIWDEATGERQQILVVSNTNLYDLSWSPDGRYFAALAPDRGVTLWDAHRWLVLRTIIPGSYTETLAWSPDGKTLATAGMGVILWDAASGEQVGVLGQDTATQTIAWSADGSKIVAASGGWAVIWDVKTGQPLVEVTEGHSWGVESAALSPDGRVLASAAGEVILRDAGNGKIVQTWEGHSDGIIQLAFSPDGKTLASGSYDGTVILWDMAPYS